MKLLMTLLLVGSTMFISGCGKKDAPKKDSKKSGLLSKKSEIPMYDCSGLELFENEGDSFAFVGDKDKTAKSAKSDVTDADLTLSWNEQDGDKAFAPVLFTFNKHDIRADQKPVVAKDAALAKEATTEGHKVVCLGHTDDFGSASYNLSLSEKRAVAMKEELISQGIDAEQIECVGYGKELPLVWSDAQDRETRIKDLQANRRTEVTLAS